VISLYGRGIVMAELGFGSCSRVVLLQTRLAPNAAATDERHWHDEMISDDRARRSWLHGRPVPAFLYTPWFSMLLSALHFGPS
jgi:hypothetical protein